MRRRFLASGRCARSLLAGVSLVRELDSLVRFEDMPIEHHTRLGSYEILEPIGAGGMGEVYRARDTKLEREVAVKVLPAIFAEAPERLARFERDAKLLASLNHPNIAAIYGIERSNSILFLVLELVPGETLAERLQRGPIPVEEAIGLAIQIADALDAAHAKGVIHRDLKPANVKITPTGKTKSSTSASRKLSTRRALQPMPPTRRRSPPRKRASG